MILPAEDTATWDSAQRFLTSFAYVGVSQRQCRNHRRSLAQVEQDAFKRTVHDLVKKAQQILDSLGGIAQLAQAAKFVLSLVQEVVKEYGAPRILASLPAAEEGATVVIAALALA